MPVKARHAVRRSFARYNPVKTRESPYQRPEILMSWPISILQNDLPEFPSAALLSVSDVTAESVSEKREYRPPQCTWPKWTQPITLCSFGPNLPQTVMSSYQKAIFKHALYQCQLAKIFVWEMTKKPPEQGILLYSPRHTDAAWRYTFHIQSLLNRCHCH